MTDLADTPALALALAITTFGTLPPPWFVAVEAPACGAELSVAASATTDNLERRFRCDLIAGHPEDRHRQVTDNVAGTTLTWPVVNAVLA